MKVLQSLLMSAVLLFGFWPLTVSGQSNLPSLPPEEKKIIFEEVCFLINSF